MGGTMRTTRTDEICSATTRMDRMYPDGGSRCCWCVASAAGVWRAGVWLLAPPHRRTLQKPVVVVAVAVREAP